MDRSLLAERAKSRNMLPLIAALWSSLVAEYLFFVATMDRSSATIVIWPEMSRFEMAKHAIANAVIDYASVVAVTDFDSASGLTIPIFLALSPLLFQEHRRSALVVAGALTFGVCLLWPLHIAALYMPTAALLFFGTTQTPPVPATSSEATVDTQRMAVSVSSTRDDTDWLNTVGAVATATVIWFVVSIVGDGQSWPHSRSIAFAVFLSMIPVLQPIARGQTNRWRSRLTMAVVVWVIGFLFHAFVLDR